jgi:hypothetical protein
VETTRKYGSMGVWEYGSALVTSHGTLYYPNIR